LPEPDFDFELLLPQAASVRASTRAPAPYFTPRRGARTFT
jgi:hypothetical protein